MRTLLIGSLLMILSSITGAEEKGWLNEMGEAWDQTSEAARKAYGATAEAVGKAGSNIAEGSKSLYESTKQTAGSAAQATSEGAQKLYDKTSAVARTALSTFQTDPAVAAWCTDDARIRHWDEVLATQSTDLQRIRLYGLWKGLCVMTQKEQIPLHTAQSILSEEAASVNENLQIQLASRHLLK